MCFTFSKHLQQIQVISGERTSSNPLKWPPVDLFRWISSRDQPLKKQKTPRSLSKQNQHLGVFCPFFCWNIRQWRITHLSNEKIPGWLGYIEGIILPNYSGIVISDYKDPYTPTRIQWKVTDPGFFRGSPGVFSLQPGFPPIKKASKKRPDCNTDQRWHCVCEQVSWE